MGRAVTLFCLDTHAVLFWFLEPHRLSERAATLFEKERGLIVSSVVPWELAILASSGRRPETREILHEWPQAVTEEGWRELPVTSQHAVAVARLPLHHRDPFDRMLVAQALVEGAAIVTADRAIARYGVPVLW